MEVTFIQMYVQLLIHLDRQDTMYRDHKHFSFYILTVKKAYENEAM